MQKIYAHLLLPIETACGRKFDDAQIKTLARRLATATNEALEAASLQITTAGGAWLPSVETLVQAVERQRAATRQDTPRVPHWQQQQDEEAARKRLSASALEVFSRSTLALEAQDEGWWDGHAGLKAWARELACSLSWAATIPPPHPGGSLAVCQLIPDYATCGWAVVDERKRELSALVHQARRTRQVEITVPEWVVAVMRERAFWRREVLPNRPSRPQHPAAAVKAELETGAGENILSRADM